MTTTNIKHYCLSTGILVRIGKTEAILEQYENGYLSFGCPANWINYATKMNDGIADGFEAISGYLRKDDYRLKGLYTDGVILNRAQSYWLDEAENGWVYVRNIIHCLTPTVCFYSMPIREMAEAVAKDKGSKDFKISLDLTDYKNSLGFQGFDDKSALIIESTQDFFSDLKKNLIPSVSMCDNLLQNVNNDDAKIIASMVSYDLDIEKEFFEISAYDDIFRKRACFSKQNEARIIIPNFAFYDNQFLRNEKYVNNYMKVFVPKIKEYSSVHSIDKMNKLDFWGFSDDFKTYMVGNY